WVGGEWGAGRWGGGGRVGGRCEGGPPPAVPGGRLVASGIDQDAAHGLGGGGKEVPAALPARPLGGPDQPEGRLVNQGGRLEGLVGRFARQPRRPELPQLVVDEGEQFGGGRGAAGRRGAQESRRLGHPAQCNDSRRRRKEEKAARPQGEGPGRTVGASATIVSLPDAPIPKRPRRLVRQTSLGRTEPMKHLSPLLIVLGLAGEAPAQVVKRDVPYADPAEKKQVLDVFSPQGAKGLPVVVWIHGGGWQTGDKTDVQIKPQAFNDKGLVFVSINYRL